MIRDQDRSGWFGASDTARVVGNWNTETFRLWWLEKMGIRKSNLRTLAMQTGNAFEHRILEHIGVQKMDRQIRIRSLRLRVNLDGETSARVKEVKTYSGKDFKVSRSYWMQAQVEMYASGKPCDIVAYHLDPEDYLNWFRPIEDGKISEHLVPYDRKWVNAAYLPRLKYLSECLKKGVWPSADH